MIVGIVSKTKQNQTNDTLVLAKPPRDFIGGVSSAAAKLKYEVAGTDQTKNIVRLSQSTSFLESTFVGPNRTIMVELKLEPDGRTVSILYVLGGNLGSAKQEKVTERIEKLKAALRQELG